MSQSTKSRLGSLKRTEHSTSDFAKATHPPFAELGKEARGAPMLALLNSLKILNKETTRRPGK
ncbi:MAG: hypothetical protein ACPG3X_03285 [Opitutales bacterium]